MSKGRKPQPTKLKLLKGTDRADRINEHEPKTEPVAIMVAPAYLNNTAKSAFRELVKMVGSSGMNILAEVDKTALAMLCDQYSIYREARYALKDGLTYESIGRNGIQQKPVPEVGIMNGAWDRVGKMMVEFGLTPSSRSRVNEVERQEKDAFEEFMNQDKKQANASSRKVGQRCD